MIWLRLLLAALLFGASAWVGRSKARRLDLRTKALDDLLGFFRQFEAMMRVSSRAIPDALRECAGRLEGSWAGGLAEILAGKYGARADSAGLWASALREAAKGSEEAAALDREDCRALSLFGDQLANADMKSLNENFAFLYGRLGEQMQASDRDRAVKGRLYGAIGMLAGLAAAIVVL
jgi:stage III sporulation protein AB